MIECEVEHNEFDEKTWLLRRVMPGLYDKIFLKRGFHGTPGKALANKWVKVIFALWQKRETYNESFHLWDKARYALKARAA